MVVKQQQEWSTRSSRADKQQLHNGRIEGQAGNTQIQPSIVQQKEERRTFSIQTTNDSSVGNVGGHDDREKDVLTRDTRKRTNYY